MSIEAIPNLQLSEEVSEALAQSRPVVALESTIITHGMPSPDNVTTALLVESDIRDEGAVPATIAVIDGILKIGLHAAELKQLAAATDVMKLSRADLAACIVQGRTGSTTVAATMIAAHLAGIGVFATGGIGGVHQGYAATLDISADLGELSRTPVCVVCAGAKAILDLPATFEVLETLGVPVLGWRCDELPAFWSHQSGLATPIRIDELQQLASFLKLRQQMRIDGGVLVTNPVPSDFEISADKIQLWIDQAIRESRTDGITGKAVTPYLLDRIKQLSEGRSLQTNVALIRNNARLAAQIAVASCQK